MLLKAVFLLKNIPVKNTVVLIVIPDPNNVTMITILDGLAMLNLRPSYFNTFQKHIRMLHFSKKMAKRSGSCYCSRWRLKSSYIFQQFHVISWNKKMSSNNSLWIPSCRRNLDKTGRQENITNSKILLHNCKHNSERFICKKLITPSQ